VRIEIEFGFQLPTTAAAVGGYVDLMGRNVRGFIVSCRLIWLRVVVAK
jgi:hypothetical protein